jgi:electron transport complex protein RnfA
MNQLQNFTKVYSGKPILVLVLGTCSLSHNIFLTNGMGMGANDFCTGSHVMIFTVKSIPDKVRIPAFIMIIASFITIVDLVRKLMYLIFTRHWNIYTTYYLIVLFLEGLKPLPVKLCSVIPADGLRMGLSFTIALGILGAFREIVGSGAIFGYKFINGDGILVFILAPGAFIALGYMIALVIKSKRLKKKLMEYILIISAIIVNNVVLAQFLGICPFLGVSNKVGTAMGMAVAVTFVIVLATMVTYLVQVYVLDKLGIAFMQTITFILVIAALVQMVEIILKKISQPLYQALGIFLPLITTNCAVLGVAILIVKDYNLLEGVIYGGATAIGFGLALIILAGIREQLELADIPKGMKGVPLSLVIAGILALAFMGFTGIVK